MSLVVALLVLAADADAGFEPVVLDIHHGAVFERTSDGGYSDAPRDVDGGTWMDDATTLWVAKNKASWRAQAQVPPNIDTGTLTLVSAIMLAIGLVFGGALVWWWMK